jgi:hypothetical protein
MRISSLYLATALLLLGNSAALAEPKAVVELFTSQGCSSCPPADKLLGELAQEDDLIALTMPVTIWDHLGWSDTLASQEMTERQIAYAQARGDRRVYTPQVVVCGVTAVVGSDRRAIYTAIRDLGPLPLPVAVSKIGGNLKIDVGASDAAGVSSATIWLSYVDPAVTVPIGRGENSGRTITYHNVVGDLQPLGMWRGKPITIELPIDAHEQVVDAGVVILVQTDDPAGPGRIIGAAKIDTVFNAREAQLSAR